MMVAIFAAMTLAFALALRRRPRAAEVAALLALVLTLGLFLWEVHDPQTGFAMPWLQGARASGTVPA